jgi:Helix-turn-helix domain of transposase family ISL3/zinc-finger of transposase IS204/IS1001/IS1096/IS1165
VLGASVWRHMLGVDRATVIEVIDFDEESETVVVHVRPRRSTKRRCGRCGTRAPGYDQGEGRRNWRAVDLGTLRCFLQADAPRVNCCTHGPTVAQVPWARHNAGHTRDFDDTVAWLAVQTSKTAVTELMRIAWRSVGTIITRVSADIDARVDRLEGLRRIGIDEISYKRSPLPDGDRGPRQRPAGVGRRWPGPQDCRELSRPARGRARRLLFGLGEGVIRAPPINGREPSVCGSRHDRFGERLMCKSLLARGKMPATVPPLSRSTRT